MKRYFGYLAVIIITCFLVGCTSEPAPSEQPVISSSSPAQASEQEKPNEAKEQLFEAKEMDAIALTGQEILDGKEADMSVKISDNINMDFHISRDNPNGTKLYAIYNSQAINLAVNYISPDVFDNDEAIVSDTYQISCYDFNKDGMKEVIIACGNKSDKLSLFVFRVVTDSEFIFYPTNYILGYKNAYVNDSNEICVPAENGVKTYKYNVAAQDAEYARQSGPIKITVNFAEQEQLGKYKDVAKFVLNEDGPSILVVPTETLSNVTVRSIQYNADTDKYAATEDLFSIPEIAPDQPLVLQFFMPDFPILGVSYTDASGMEQFCGIGESLEDGSLYLFEMEVAKG